jgi:hypothetical protein
LISFFGSDKRREGLRAFFRSRVSLSVGGGAGRARARAFLSSLVQHKTRRLSGQTRARACALGASPMR